MEISKPTLLVDKEKCLRNIERMVDKAKGSNSSLRPHFKTHHSATIASWFKEVGVDRCTASSVSMARYFSQNGWDDITIAFPFNPLESDQISEIAKNSKLNILIESEESLQAANERIQSHVGFFVKIDVGTHRTGIDHRNTELIQKLVNASNDKIQFRGFLAHAGHTYGAHDKENVQWIFEGARKILVDLKKSFGGILSYGDTPSCSMLEDFSDFEEIRPGNFVFYDWMQHEIGSCTIEDISVCMACPVVALHPEREEIVIYGGGVHLSKDSVPHGKMKTFGQCVKLKPNGWETEVFGNLERISQEHGVIKMKKESIAHVKVGDLIGVIPVHSCLTADLQGHYRSTDGERIDKIIKD